MMLWDIIRDFFVQYIFGGYTSNGDNYFGCIGGFQDLGFNMDGAVIGTADEVFVLLPFAYNGDNTIGKGELLITLGDWLSTTATIITLCAICVFLFFFVRWLFRLTAGLVSGRG